MPTIGRHGQVIKDAGTAHVNQFTVVGVADLVAEVVIVIFQGEEKPPARIVESSAWDEKIAFEQEGYEPRVERGFDERGKSRKASGHEFQEVISTLKGRYSLWRPGSNGRAFPTPAAG